MKYVVVFDGQVMGVVDDDTQASGCSDPAWNVARPRCGGERFVRNKETVLELGRLIFRTFQCEVELDYNTGSSFLLVVIAKHFLKHEELVSVNLSGLHLLCIRLRSILQSWSVNSDTNLPIHGPATP